MCPIYSRRKETVPDENIGRRRSNQVHCPILLLQTGMRMPYTAPATKQMLLGMVSTSPPSCQPSALPESCVSVLLWYCLTTPAQPSLTSSRLWAVWPMMVVMLGSGLMVKLACTTTLLSVVEGWLLRLQLSATTLILSSPAAFHLTGTGCHTPEQPALL